MSKKQAETQVVCLQKSYFCEICYISSQDQPTITHMLCIPLRWGKHPATFQNMYLTTENQRHFEYFVPMIFTTWPIMLRFLQYKFHSCFNVSKPPFQVPLDDDDFKSLQFRLETHNFQQINFSQNSDIKTRIRKAAYLGKIFAKRHKRSKLSNMPLCEQ